MLKKWLRKMVNEVILDSFSDAREQMQQEVASALHDVTYRINVLKEAEKGGFRVSSHDLNIATHMIDGYVFTNNSPAAGSVAWTDVNIVYKGTTYTIANGNTANKYIWWQFSATDKTKLQTSNTKPTLTADDVLLGVNDGGVFTLTMAPGKFTPGGALLDGSVGSNELGNGAVTAGKIGSGAINNSNLFASGVVTSTALGSGAVTAGKIGSGAIDNSGVFASGVVNSNALSNGAVTAGKISTGAINNANLFSAGVVDGNALGAGAVSAGKIATGAINNSNLFGSGVVDGNAIKSGVVSEDKFNVATHFLF